MQQLVKTLYLTTQGTVVRLDQDAIRVERPSERFVRVPIRKIDHVVVHGHVTISTELTGRLADDGVPISYLSRAGRFVARVQGSMSGNVLLRIAQHRAFQDPAAAAGIARQIIAAKLLNSRTVLLDAAKDRPDEADRLREVAAQLAADADSVVDISDLDHLRGIEGNGARRYLAVLGQLASPDVFRFTKRSRRPPADPMNALLSYLYALLRIRCVGAAEAVGLDPQLGFLHAVRPGRPSLALDLMEEFRSTFADRHALTLVNRRQLNYHHFVERFGGAWELTDDGRRIVLETWDALLDTEVPHRVLGIRTSRRHVVHLQAVLLARHLRGDLDAYLPFRTVGR
jgi:CRISP-associated protein Cas1